jgi:hypothetical protein
VSLIWENACIVRKCLVESEGSTLLCGLYCDRLVCELLGSNEMTECSPGRDGRTPNLVESRVIWQGLLESRRQITLSVRMMAKENKMLLSTT